MESHGGFEKFAEMMARSSWIAHGLVRRHLIFEAPAHIWREMGWALQAFNTFAICQLLWIAFFWTVFFPPVIWNILPCLLWRDYLVVFAFCSPKLQGDSFTEFLFWKSSWLHVKIKCSCLLQTVRDNHLLIQTVWRQMRTTMNSSTKHSELSISFRLNFWTELIHVHTLF